MSTIHYIDIADFYDNKCNCLFITGIFGSGKTTLAKKMASANNAKIICLDDIEDYYDRKRYDLFPYEFKEFLELSKFDKNVYYYSIQYLIREFCIYLMDKRKEDRFIIEGYQLITIIPTLFDYRKNRYKIPIVLIEINPVLALFRKFKREMEGCSIIEKISALINGTRSSYKYQMHCLRDYKELVENLKYRKNKYEEYYKEEER